MNENKTLLVVAAHPDDEILGCAGTVAKLVSSGWKAFVLVLGEGVTSRTMTRADSLASNDLILLKKQMNQANRVIGVSQVFTGDLPDNRFDSVNMLDIVKIVEKVKDSIKPNLVFTHSESDLNLDHRLTYNAVLTATRPMRGETVKRILSFEVLSSTEWRYPLSFSPDVFYCIKSTLALKMKAMRLYKSELRKFPHPRSIKGIRNLAEFHGIRTGLDYAEAFKLVRENNI